MNTKTKNYATTAVFAVMFLYLVMQFGNVMVYFDDYGYYSLSYGVDIGQNGHDFTFGQIFLFLKEHYFECNGRLPGYLIWLTAYCIGGLKAVQLLAAVITFAVLFLIWKFVGEEKHTVLSAILICAFYGLFTINVQRQGTYWFAAFFQYVAPIVPIILFVMLYFKYRESKLTAMKVLVLSLLVLLSAYSQEQLGVTVAFMICLLIVYEWFEKKPWLHNVLFLGIALISAAILMFGPATQSRVAGHEKSMIDVIVGSTYTTIHTFFSNEFRVFLILLFVALFSVSIDMLKREKYKIFVWADAFTMLISCVSIIVYIITPIQQILNRVLFNRYLLILCGGAVAALIALQIMRYYWQNKQHSKLLLFMTAVGSIGCLCAVPEIPLRLFIPSWLMLFPTLCEGVLLFAKALFRTEKMFRIGLNVVSAAVLIVAIVNAGSIYLGYSQNADVWMHNDKILQEASDFGKNNLPVEKLYLKTYPNDAAYAAVPYNDGVAYITYWMKDYYDFSYDPKFYFSADGLNSGSDADYVHLALDVYLKP